MRVLVVAALAEEVKDIQESGTTEVLVTGMGKVNAAYALMKRLKTPSKPPVNVVINLGTAGAFDGPYKRTVLIDEVADRDFNLKGAGEPLPAIEVPISQKLLQNLFTEGYGWLKCYSGDVFATDLTQYPAGCVDMECYALAHVCLNERVRFMACKYISDAGSVQEWKASLPDAASELADSYYKLRYLLGKE